MKKLLTLSLIAVLLMATIPTAAMATSSIDDLLQQPGLKPGDLLKAGAAENGLYDAYYGYDGEYAIIIIRPIGEYATRGIETTQYDFIIKGDSVEFGSPIITYDTGAITCGTTDGYSDGEHATAILDMSKGEKYAEVFVPFRSVRGQSDTVLFSFYERDNQGILNSASNCQDSARGWLYYDHPDFINTAPDPSRISTRGGSVLDLIEIEDPDDPHCLYATPRIWPMLAAIGQPNEPVAPPTTPGTGNTPSTWATTEVDAAIATGLVPLSLQSGYTNQITRAEYCALAVAVYETYSGTVITERRTFVDTNDVNVEKMAAVGVVEGVGEGRFDPDGLLRREHAATMLSRLANALGKPLPIHAATFSDNADISSWAIEGAGQVQAAGIMGGIGNNTFAPKDPYTREQSIITMIRLWNKA